MKEEKLKQAFSKIKEDILNIGKEISEIREQFLISNQLMKQLNKDIIHLKLEKIIENTPPTHNQETSTHPAISTHTPTHPQEIQGLKSPDLPISTGNQGVPTDKQTNRQTNQHTHEIPEIPQKTQEIQEIPIEQQISEASEILDSLDSIRKDIRRKFQKITKQEMLVFSTVYTLEEQDPEGVDYNKIASKLSLSQSSIRDYIHRIIEKGIPITKEKLNNKKILLHISPELKKIATLDAIIKLRRI